MLKIRAAERQGDRRCPLCLDPVEGRGARTRSCGGCETIYHRACLRELGGCSTLGCSEKGTGGRARSAPQQETTGRRHENYHRALGPDGPPPLRSLALHRYTRQIDDTRLRVDPTTPLEHLFMWGAMSSGAGLAISLFSLLGHDHPPLGVFGVLGVLLVFFGVLAAKTDNFYIFDVEQRAVFFNRQILSHHTVAPLLDFDRISGFAVNAKEQSTKQRSWWDYWVVMIRDDGKQIRLTDGLEEGLISANALARGLAEHAGCDYWQGRHGSPIRVRVDSAQGVQVTHGRSYTTAIVLGVAVVAGLIVVALAAVL